MSLRIAYLALAVSPAVFGNTQVNRIGVTNTQALITVITDQPGNCTYRVSVSSSLAPVVSDVIEVLFPDELGCAHRLSSSRQPAYVRGGHANGGSGLGWQVV